MEEFTFFSSTHEMFRKIEHLLCWKASLHRYRGLEIMCSMFSDSSVGNKTSRAELGDSCVFQMERHTPQHSVMWPNRRGGGSAPLGVGWGCEQDPQHQREVFIMRCLSLALSHLSVQVTPQQHTCTCGRRRSHSDLHRKIKLSWMIRNLHQTLGYR